MLMSMPWLELDVNSKLALAGASASSFATAVQRPQTSCFGCMPSDKCFHGMVRSSAQAEDETIYSHSDRPPTFCMPDTSGSDDQCGHAVSHTNAIGDLLRVPADTCAC